jgi:coenzyme PQQ precursor peptide PqqA
MGPMMTSTKRPSTGTETAMSWKAPKVVEIALGAEINSYACADASK